MATLPNPKHQAHVQFYFCTLKLSSLDDLFALIDRIEKPQINDLSLCRDYLAWICALAKPDIDDFYNDNNIVKSYYYWNA